MKEKLNGRRYLLNTISFYGIFIGFSFILGIEEGDWRGGFAITAFICVVILGHMISSKFSMDRGKELEDKLREIEKLSNN